VVTLTSEISASGHYCYSKLNVQICKSFLLIYLASVLAGNTGKHELFFRRRALNKTNLEEDLGQP